MSQFFDYYLKGGPPARWITDGVPATLKGIDWGLENAITGARAPAEILNIAVMFKNYWKVAIRSLLKRKGYTLINVLGLSMGMAVCGLIVLFIRSELSYDDFQPNSDRVYRIVLDHQYPGRTTSYAIIPASIGDAVRKEFPEVAAKTSFQDATNNGTFFIKAGDRSFEETHVLQADSNFFRVFPTRMLEGDPVTALQKPFTLVLTELTAKRYFGSPGAAIGKVLETEGNSHFTVTAVCADRPDNSHMAYELPISAASFPLQEPNYVGFSDYTYLPLNKGADPAVPESKLPGIVEKYVSGRDKPLLWHDISSISGVGQRISLLPATAASYPPDLGSGSGNATQWKHTGDLYFRDHRHLHPVCIACINFINLATARSVERAKEVGIRKTFGSEKRSPFFSSL